ncbi:TetR/AcrR family transcriptional regulator [Arthrobacter sp. NPDC090010]|uniref:TetR/AcrR family transcriptional regulator n=1 Tax=Arthrobacter sp. NPDC090010 TaxID=3363942 RepID=UPI0037F20734
MENAKSRKGAAKREEILRVALEVFGDGGEEQASLREIARRCGTTTGGILYYFESKEDLLVEVLRSRDFYKDGGPATVDSFMSDGDLHEDFSILEQQIRHNTENPGLVALFVAMGSRARAAGHPAAPFFRDRYDRMRASIVEYLKGFDVHPRNGLSHETAATIALATMDGLQLQWLADESVDMVAAIQGAFSAVYELPDGVPPGAAL